MFKVLIVFLIVIAGVVLGPMFEGHQGLAYFQFAGYRVKMSFTVFIILQGLLLLILYLLQWLCRKIVGANNIFEQFIHFIFPNRSAHKMASAQLMQLEGNHQKAEKFYAKAAKSTSYPTVAYLQAAQAAIDADNLIDANQLLEKAASNCTPKEELAFQLVQIRLQIKNNEWSAARRQVDVLLDAHPRHREVLRLAHQIYTLQHDYQAIIGILPAMYKADVFNEQTLDTIKQTAHLNAIRLLAQGGDGQGLLTWWKAQPKAVRANIVYQQEMFQRLTELNLHDDAEKMRQQINKNSQV